MYGITPPQITQLQLAAGQVPGFNYPIPVVRIVFDAKVFFDFNKAEIVPEALPVLDVIAQNMKRDVPDANLLLLGHTDAIGSDEYNIELSRQRAESVMRGLIARGVRPSQLTTVAIGKAQPIASNMTEEGRAKNRRVEFMISASQEANLQLVERFRIVKEYLKTAAADPEPQIAAIERSVEVYRPVEIPKPATPAPAPRVDPRSPYQVLPQQPEPAPQIELKPVRELELRKPSPLQDPVYRKPTTPELRAPNDYDVDTPVPG